MNVFQKVAEINGVSIDNVKKEVSVAIEKGFQSPEPQIKEMWNSLFPDGKMPAPETFVKIISTYTVNMITE